MHAAIKTDPPINMRRVHGSKPYDRMGKFMPHALNLYFITLQHFSKLQKLVKLCNRVRVALLLPYIYMYHILPEPGILRSTGNDNCSKKEPSTLFKYYSSNHALWTHIFVTHAGAKRQLHELHSLSHLKPNHPQTSGDAMPVQSSYRPKNSTFLDRRKEELHIDDIRPGLTAANYKEKFQKLLCWEKMEHITLLHDR